MFGPRDIAGHGDSRAFRVGHFSEDPAARAGDAFDGRDRSVRVDENFIRGHAVRVRVLSGDLSIGREGCEGGSVCEEAAFAMGERQRVEIARAAIGQPW